MHNVVFGDFNWRSAVPFWRQTNSLECKDIGSVYHLYSRTRLIEKIMPLACGNINGWLFCGVNRGYRLSTREFFFDRN